MNPKEKILAYYFPQYHSIPENDKVFGKDFTDWELFKDETNSRLSLCKLPVDPPEGLGYYDPTLLDTRQKQAALAKKYGVDGFIYYHYWLENQPVMNKVIDNLIIDNEPNLPFCLCFANASWLHLFRINSGQKKYHPDGSTFRQLYDKPKDHAEYLQKIFNHPNYLRIENKPVLFIYKLNPEVMCYINNIINELKNFDIDSLYIIVNTSAHCLSTNTIDNIIPDNYSLINAYSPFMAHYNKIMSRQDILSELPNYLLNLPCTYGALMGWNCIPRYPYAARIQDYKPEFITKQICKDLLLMRQDKLAIPFYTLFAWNEWGEGAIIEPNSFYGEELGYAIKKGRELADIIETKYSNVNFEYGNFKYNSYLLFKNIKNLVYEKCIDYRDNKWCIYIPKGDYNRSRLFGDPLIGVLKVIKINNKIYNENEESIILL